MLMLSTILQEHLYFLEICDKSLNQQHKPAQPVLSHRAYTIRGPTRLPVLKDSTVFVHCVIIIFQPVCVMQSLVRGDYWRLRWLGSSSDVLCAYVTSWNMDNDFRSCTRGRILCTGLFAFFLLCKSRTLTGFKGQIIQASSSLGSGHNQQKYKTMGLKPSFYITCRRHVSESIKTHVSHRYNCISTDERW